ncbi:DUF6493 family protein [Blastopirellula marina]|uniref:DUF7824 domain-containing protein n=1 Tax=Blastopirellula marina TaxID=124 RepID=A0A2S8F9J3_9BACT|nr:DUF6493 family protein [Blastopirellula marina]PQO28836.1 hypothetical protein C5Y98_24020 [Blastopirellula marina]PTL42109.1 hypothetical protein C5Y97_24035 [Blastopirellula marina]
MIEALEAALLSKDVAQIVKALSTASEEERLAAQRPLKTLWLALGIDSTFLRDIHPDLNEGHPDVRKKRARYKLTPMVRDNNNYDYQLGNLARLAWFGIADQANCHVSTWRYEYEAESAQIMADRRPPWLDAWVSEMTKPDWHNITSSFWVLLYQHGLISPADHNTLQVCVAGHGLPRAFELQREATQKALREIPEIVERIYNIPSDPQAHIIPKEWEPVISWLNAEGLLDSERLVAAALAALAEPLNQSERNCCVIFAKAAIGKPTPKSRKVSLAFQSQWIGMLSDAQAVVAGFALDHLLQIEKLGKLNASDVVVEIPSLFQHKPKGHARKAVALLGRLAKSAELRPDAVRGLTFALAHPAKEVQEEAIEQLAIYLENSDDDAIDAIRLHTETVAPTLRARLETLLPNAPAELSAEPETLAVSGLGELSDRLADVSQDAASLFHLHEALSARDSGQLAEPGCWRMNQIRVLDNYEEIPPIESIDELVQVTSAAVESCECPDTLERVVDGIVRLCNERPKHFKSLTQALRKRACQPIMLRPLRGIVGGYVGESMTRIIGAWLKEKGFLRDLLTPNGFPPAEFLWEVAERLLHGKAYPLLSTPTHRGGWIDPRVWIHRLSAAEESAAELLESDLVRSLLRLAPDRRDEAWHLVAEGTCPVSARVKHLVQIAIEPVDSLDDFKLDDRWPVPVWMAAIRARDPWIDLASYLPPEEIAQVPIELWRLPDVFRPANYQWKATEAIKGGGRYLRPIKMSAVAEEDRNPLEAEVNQLRTSLNSEPLNPENIMTILAIGKAEQQLSKHWECLTVQLNNLKVSHAPAYLYPYLATLWPMKLDWYWGRSTLCLVDRIESGSSVEERYAQFLLPLFEPDRCVTTMAARALWIATASKDSNAKTMATEVWIELMNSDRCHTSLLVDAWDNVFEGGWMKLSRVAEVLTEASAAGPLPAWITAKLISTFLARHDELPRDAAKLLELLDECHQRLGLAVNQPLHDKLSAIKSGKAKQVAKSLLAREEQPTSQRAEAMQQALEARLARAERNSLSAMAARS